MAAGRFDLYKEPVIFSADLNSWRAAHEAAAWVDRSARQQLRVIGGDRVSFVQGMVTSDVVALGIGSSQYAAMLTAKGSMIGDARILKRDEDVLLDVEPGTRTTVKEFLEKYLISEDAEVQPADELAVLGLLGPRHTELLGKLPTGAQVGMLIGLQGTPVDVLIHREALETVRAALKDFPVIDEATAQVLRIEAGEPRWGSELVATTIPLEASLERAISYTKGCYIGQEVIARATHRGQMQRKLAGLLLGELTPENGTELRRGEKKVGWITSVAHSPKRGQVIALGYVHRDSLEPGTQLELASGGTAAVAALPF
jgi:folate-binding protein YgfZ